MAVSSFSSRSDTVFSTSPSLNLRCRHSPLSSPILRFPPNFRRQLTTAALRNSSSISVVQIAVASCSNRPSATASASVDESAAPVTFPLYLAANEDLADAVQLNDTDAIIHTVGRLGVDTTVIDAITTPGVNTSAYSLHKTTDPFDIKGNHQVVYQCGRYGNTPRVALEQKISAIEGGESTWIMASGMIVSAVMMMALIPAGGHVVTTAECYRKHRTFIETMLPKMRITNTVIDPTDVVALESALEHHNVSLFLTESPTNPFLKSVDIKLVSELCHRKGTVLCIDATFAAPLNQKPLPLGADLILHSLTKYIGGPQDVFLGSCISCSARLVSQVQNLYHNLGGTVNPVLYDKPDIKIAVVNMVDGTLNHANGITFLDEEIIPELIKHPKLLYVSAKCRGYPINEVLVDAGATMNVLPSSTSTMLGVRRSDLTPSKFRAVGYDGVKRGILGEIVLPVGIEGRIYRVSFQVMEMKQPPYKMLLGTPWLNENKAVSSPLHQCVKYEENGVTIIIPGEGYPVPELA